MDFNITVSVKILWETQTKLCYNVFLVNTELYKRKSIISMPILQSHALFSLRVGKSWSLKERRQACLKVAMLVPLQSGSTPTENLAISWIWYPMWSPVGHGKASRLQPIRERRLRPARRNRAVVEVCALGEMEWI